MKYLNELVSQFKIDEIPMTPCTTEDLINVGKMISNQKLPMAYIEFLETMGNGTDHTFFAW